MRDTVSPADPRGNVPTLGPLLFAGSLALCALCAATPVDAQSGQTPKQTPKPTTRPSLAARKAKAIALLDRWLGGPTTREELEETVKAIHDAEADGLALLAQRRRGAEGRLLESVDEMIGYVGLGWLDQVEKSGMIYPGQYEPLRPLMPSIGQFYLELILETPQDYPITRRERVIAAVRDLYPRGPSEVAMDKVLAMATDTDEPKTLRTALAYALAQWGDRKLIRTQIRELERASRSKDDETALLSMRHLAQIHYGIRDYAVAAVGYQDFIRKAKEIDGYLIPVHYYNAACCMALSGNPRSAFEFLRRCLELNKSPRVDSSVRLERDLFEKDPEIALVRKMPGFQKLLDDAFGAESGKTKDAGGKDGGDGKGSGDGKGKRAGRAPR